MCCLMTCALTGCSPNPLYEGSTPLKLPNIFVELCIELGCTTVRQEKIKISYRTEFLRKTAFVRIISHFLSCETVDRKARLLPLYLVYCT